VTNGLSMHKKQLTHPRSTAQASASILKLYKTIIDVQMSNKKDSGQKFHF